jgi:hypothetical protein
VATAADQPAIMPLTLSKGADYEDDISMEIETILNYQMMQQNEDSHSVVSSMPVAPWRHSIIREQRNLQVRHPIQTITLPWLLMLLTHGRASQRLFGISSHLERYRYARDAQRSWDLKVAGPLEKGAIQLSVR